jgi:hypothetical protein
MISAIKDGRPGDGFVAAVEQCGAELARYFPPGRLNPDELPNKVHIRGECPWAEPLLGRPGVEPRGREAHA